MLLSSIGVMGIHTNGREPFYISDMPKPVEDDAISKWEAEQASWAMSVQTGFGGSGGVPAADLWAGVKGNLLRLLQLT